MPVLLRKLSRASAQIACGFNTGLIVSAPAAAGTPLARAPRAPQVSPRRAGYACTLFRRKPCEQLVRQVPPHAEVANHPVELGDVQFLEQTKIQAAAAENRCDERRKHRQR